MSSRNIKPEAEGSSLNYFACTLGQAAEQFLCNLSDLETINDFINHQAEKFPDFYAVGFPAPSPDSNDWAYELLTFKDLQSRSVIRARTLQENLQFQNRSASRGEKCVALLCPSSLEFVITWLALIRCGFSVLLVAPQCQPEAITGLCDSCNVSILLNHRTYEDLAAKAASRSTSNLKSVPFFWPPSGEIGGCDDEGYQRALLSTTSSTYGDSQSTAFIFHTSGTSTGIPSPIRQSHRAAFAVLPTLSGSQKSTFTTTPLYHGGIADCFRAWTSAALIWLFPGADVPITTQNIRSSLKTAVGAAENASAAPVRYFSCVPYVLQMLSEDGPGLHILKSMEIVGVGGAALSKALGDRLVENKVNLISRFGSAECGFLLSSYREFETDKEWDYLRLDLRSERLCFQECHDESGLSELVVKPGWPHLAKMNREDGSFATSDLFEPHPTIKNAWRYHSRRDGQITLSTGKKFDPVPLEEEIAACSPAVREALVVGNGRQGAAVIVFLSVSREEANARDVYDEIWHLMEAIISKYPSHVRMFRANVTFLTGAPLPRSSKGTLMRGVVEKMFADEIDSVYATSCPLKATTTKTLRSISREDAKEMVREAVSQVLKNGQQLNDEDDFYTHGVDSIMCTRIRATLQQSISPFLQEGTDSLPWNVVYDYGNIRRLSTFIATGGNVQSDFGITTEMRGMVEKFSTIDVDNYLGFPQQDLENSRIAVVLTGATGVLGAHILDNLRNDASVTLVFCLVRAAADGEARRRVSKSLVDRGKKPLDSTELVTCYPYSADKVRLGLSEQAYEHIRSTVTHVIHAAWDVNFSLPLRSFDPHFTGLQSLLQLAYAARYQATFSFCSSVASISSKPEEGGAAIKERLSLTPLDASPTGYGRSKWVAEAICAATARKQQTQGRVKVKILRLGQLTGDTETGAWNRSEAWPRMLSTVDILNCLPSIEQPLDWLPLDTAARAVLEATFAEFGKDEKCPVYHLVNYRTEETWMDLMGWIRGARENNLRIMEPQEWLDRLERYPEEHPAKALLGLWRDAYGEGSVKHEKPIFSVDEAKKMSPTMRNLEPISEEHGKKIWMWLDGKK